MLELSLWLWTSMRRVYILNGEDKVSEISPRFIDFQFNWHNFTFFFFFLIDKRWMLSKIWCNLDSLSSQF